jgi:hypothetical protein
MKLSKLCKNEKGYDSMTLFQQNDGTYRNSIFYTKDKKHKKKVRYKNLIIDEDVVFKKCHIIGVEYVCIRPLLQPIKGFYINIYRIKK